MQQNTYVSSVLEHNIQPTEMLEESI